MSRRKRTRFWYATPDVHWFFNWLIDQANDSKHEEHHDEA